MISPPVFLLSKEKVNEIWIYYTRFITAVVI